MTLVILGAGIAMGSVSLLFELRHSSAQLEESVKAHVRFMGNQTSAAAAHFLERGDMEGLDTHLSQVSADPILRAAWVCDQAGVVLAATRFADRGKLLRELTLGVRVSGRAGDAEANARIFESGGTVFGVFPFLLPPSQSKPLHSEKGLFVLEYDLETPKREAARAILLKSSAMVAALALFSMALWVAVHLLVTRRIQPLMRLAGQLADGGGATPSGLSGSDELAALSQRLDLMARDVELRASDLAKANAAMAREIAEKRAVEEALRNSERQFRSVWDNSLDAMRLTDGEGRIVQVNPAYCRIAGITSDQAIGLPFTHIHKPSLHEALLERHKHEFQQRAFATHREAELTLEDGRKLVLDATYSLVEFEHQKPLMLAILRDITERRSREAEQQRLERKLLEAQRLDSLGIMAGGIAHDFNNLLTAILGNTGLARLLLPADSPILPNLAHIDSASMRAADLCRQMLAYAGRGKLTIQQVQLGAMLGEMAALLKLSVGDRVDLQIERGTDSTTVAADPTQLRQVVLSLAINASEAMGDKPGLIRIRSGAVNLDVEDFKSAVHSPELPAGAYAFVEVADNGCGMGREMLARIFDPFFTTKFTGRGLGLAAVMGIVRSHQGALKVESSLGAGSIFSIFLPNSSSTQPVAASEPPPSHAPSLASGKVLVAEDEETVLTAIVLSLQSAGFEVATASDGREALDRLAADRDSIDAILLDLSMPVVSGEELLKGIYGIQPDARVVLMSGHDTRELAGRFSGFGLSAFLQKPFSPAEVARALTEALREKPESRGT